VAGRSPELKLPAALVLTAVLFPVPRFVISTRASFKGVPLVDVIVPVMVPVSVSVSWANAPPASVQTSKISESKVRGKNWPPWAIGRDTILMGELSNSPECGFE
jgi:hypothetical protein